MEDDEIRVMFFTYWGGEKYKSLTGKSGEKRDRGIQSKSTLCQCPISFSIVTGFLLPDGCSSMDGIMALTIFYGYRDSMVKTELT